MLVITEAVTRPDRYSVVVMGVANRFREVARPHVLEKRHGHTLHDPRKKIPQQHRAEESRHEAEARTSDTVFRYLA